MMLSAYCHLPFHFTVLSDEESLNDDDQAYSVHNAPEIQEPSPPSPQPASAPVMRQRAVAHVVPINMPNVLREIAGRDPFKVVRDIDSSYIPDGFVANDTRLWPGYDMDKENLKRKAEDISPHWAGMGKAAQCGMLTRGQWDGPKICNEVWRNVSAIH